MMAPFSPSPASASINMSTSTGLVKVSDQIGSYQVRLMNNAASTAWFRFGDKNVVADTTTCTPIAAGAAEVFTINVPYGGPLYIAAILGTGTGYLFITPGAGI